MKDIYTAMAEGKQKRFDTQFAYNMVADNINAIIELWKIDERTIDAAWEVINNAIETSMVNKVDMANYILDEIEANAELNPQKLYSLQLRFANKVSQLLSEPGAYTNDF